MFFLSQRLASTIRKSISKLIFQSQITAEFTYKMASSYSNTSPYATTKIVDDYLDIINFKKIPYDKDDVEYRIESKYQNRPDLLAYDLYGNSNYWWVFSMRNPDKIRDPVYDMIPGTVIFIPKISNF